MRTVLIGVVALALSGCGLEILTTTAIQGELAAQNANAASRALQYAKDSTSQTNAQHAIDLYKADKGENPPSLEALVPQYLEQVPVKPDGTPYGYDPVAGRLLDSAPAAAPVAAAGGGDDWQKLDTVNAAIRSYAQATGQYPASLHALVPAFLPSLPRTSAGLDFVYNPSYGVAYLPAAGAAGSMPQAAAPTAGRRGGSGVAGAGPLAETMTGISISNQLDSMSNAGASSAQGYAGSSLGRSQDQHNQQQERALQDLGM